MSADFGIRQNFNFEQQVVDSNLTSSTLNQSLIEKTKNVVAKSSYHSETETETEAELQLEELTNDVEEKDNSALRSQVENEVEAATGNQVENNNEFNPDVFNMQNTPHKLPCTKRPKKKVVDRITSLRGSKIETVFFCLKPECCNVEIDVKQNDGSFKKENPGSRFTSINGLKLHLKKKHQNDNTVHLDDYRKIIKYPEDEVIVFSRFRMNTSKRQRTQE